MRCEGATVVHGHVDPRGPSSLAAVGPSGGVRNGLDIRSLLASIGTVNSDHGVDMELSDSVATANCLAAGPLPVGDQMIIKGLNAQNFRHQFQHQLQQQQQHAYGAVLATADSSLECSGGIDDVATAAAAGSLSPTRRSANMTERVPVPSSEHVAEIVGRQGCKIKALRNKTNTYIKTPVRGEEPVFVVTGRREDVDAARREIISAAEHFSHIRAARSTAGNTSSSRHTHHNGVHRSSRQENCNDVVLRNQRSPSPASATGSKNGGSGCGSNVSDRHSGVIGNQQQVTIGVRVPMSMVGLVVGPKGATVKRIQQDTGTYIVTPGRQKDPVFEVIGSPDGVEKAKRQIEAYLETRLGPSVVTSSNTGFCGEWLGTSSTPTSGTTEALDRSSTSSLSSASSSSSSSFECGNMRSVSDVQLSPSQSDLDSTRLSSGNNASQGHCSHGVKQGEGWLKENAVQFATTADRLHSGTNGFTSISPILPAPQTSGDEAQPHTVGNNDPEALLSWFVNRMCLSNGRSSLPPMSSSYDLLHHSVSIADTLQTSWASSLCPDRNIDQQYFIDNQFPVSVSTFPGKRFDSEGIGYDLNNESSTKWNVLLAAAAAGLLAPSSAGVVDSHHRSTPVEFDDFSAGHQSSSDGFGFDYDRLESDLVCPGRLKGSVNSNSGCCWADQSTSGMHQLSALSAARSEECGVSNVSGFADTSASFGVKFGSSDEASTSSMSPVESFLVASSTSV